MSKLMEIIEKVPNFKKGTCSITLLDTNFFQLTRNIGSKTGHTVFNAVNGDVLSKEMLVSLNKTQLDFKPRIENLVNQYNAWIDSKKKIISTLENFNLIFTSLRDYSNKIVVGDTQADYYLLSEIIGAEKELYETLHFWLANHYEKNKSKLAEWSKSRPYGSNVSGLITPMLNHTYSRIERINVTCSNPAIQISAAQDGRYTAYAIISNPEIIPVGESVTITVTAVSNLDASSRFNKGTYRLTRNRLNSAIDDGYFSNMQVLNYEENYNNIGGIQGTGRVTDIRNIISPHFKTDKCSFSWIKNRIFI